MASSIKAKDLQENPFWSEALNVVYKVCYTNRQGKIMFLNGWAKQNEYPDQNDGLFEPLPFIGEIDSDNEENFNGCFTEEGARDFIDEMETDQELYIVKCEKNVILSRIK